MCCPVVTRALLAVWPTRLFLCVLVVVLWPRVRRVLRAMVLVSDVRCALIAVVFYVVRVFSLPHGADPDISDTKREIVSKAPSPKRSRAGPRMPRHP
jgi:hypothetical protein